MPGLKHADAEQVRAKVRPLTGRVPADRVHPSSKVAPAVIEAFLALEDLSSTVSDVLDKLGLQTVIGASHLRPTISERRVVGSAVTVRNRPRLEPASLIESNHDSRMEEIEGINQSDPGDVLVVQGVPDISNMGGIMATLAARQRLAGAVVDGGVRDVGRSRSLSFPVWSSSVTPVTGKWRVETVEVNGPVVIAGVAVNPGDLVIADETGVCFVPPRFVDQVLELCTATGRSEQHLLDDSEAGVTIPEIVRRYLPPRAAEEQAALVN